MALEAAAEASSLLRALLRRLWLRRPLRGGGALDWERAGGSAAEASRLLALIPAVAVGCGRRGDGGALVRPRWWSCRQRRPLRCTRCDAWELAGWCH